jgi:hypothetical protein
VRYQDLQLRIYREGHHFTVLARFGPDTVTEHVDLDLASHAALTDQALDQLTDVRDVGEALFKAIVRGRVAGLYQRARGQLANDSASALRIRMYFDPNAPDANRLMRVPWELMYDAHDGSGRFLVLDPRKTIVRTIDTSVDVMPPSPEPVRRVLIALASPQGQTWLDVQREAAVIEASFKRVGVMPVTLMHARRDTLLQTLQDGRFQIVHVMCHGAFPRGWEEGALLLETPTGLDDPVPAHIFAELFVGIPTPRLVCLAACRSADPGGHRTAQPFGSVAAALAGIGLPAVIAMQTRIRDESAQTFTERFYERLVHRDEPIEAALAAARKPMRVQRPDYGDWGIPLLFVRDVAAPAAREPRPGKPRNRRPQASEARPRIAAIGGDLNIHSGGGPVSVKTSVKNRFKKNITNNFKSDK